MKNYFESFQDKVTKLKSVLEKFKVFWPIQWDTESVNLIIFRKNCRSAYMLTGEANYSWFIIKQNFGKPTKQSKHFSQLAGNITADLWEELWLHNESYSFKKKDQTIYARPCSTSSRWIQSLVFKFLSEWACRNLYVQSSHLFKTITEKNIQSLYIPNIL